MQYSTETLMAYVDGELDAQTRQAIEAAIATDPKVAEEVARHRALQSKLRTAFGGVLDESVPERLIATARTAPAGGAAQVTDIASARAAKQAQPRRSWSLPQWGALAASLLLGVIIARAPWSDDPTGPIVADNGRMVASDALASALTNQPGGLQEGSPVQIGVSFRAKTGDYCRTFVVQKDAALAGLACHEADGWRVEALAQGGKADAGGNYRMASTELPPIIAQAVEATIAGEALDAEEEAAARERGWR